MMMMISCCVEDPFFWSLWICYLDCFASFSTLGLLIAVITSMRIEG